MIDPRTQYILYKERENELMLQIQQKLTAQARGETMETALQHWYAKAGQWLKEKVSSDLRAISPALYLKRR